MRFLSSLLFGLLLATTASAQTQPAAPAAPTPPPAAPLTFATTKVEGTDNVYIFRYQFHQSMFVVTPEGVIATDPIGYLRPQAVTTYIDEIKKVTPAPIKYVVYSHHHYDHIAGGKPFKDLGAVFIAHKRAKEHLEQLRYADVVIPDETVDETRTLKLGGTELELSYVGRNHSDNSLVMRLPKEKLLFAVDFIPIEAVNFRNMPDSWPIEWEDSLKKVEAMDWDRMIPGHPYKGRLGTKADVKNLLTYMQELSAEVKQAANQGKCLPRHGDEGSQAREISDLAQLRSISRRQHRALLLLLEPRVLAALLGATSATSFRPSAKAREPEPMTTYPSGPCSWVPARARPGNAGLAWPG